MNFDVERFPEKRFDNIILKTSQIQMQVVQLFLHAI